MLKDQILSGQLKGGMKIPEESLAEQFGVSRTPIREAIRRLAEYGLVTIKPRSHAVVSIISPQEADDIAKVRVSLEQLAIDSIDEDSYAEHVKELSRYAADCQYAMGIGDRATVFEQDSLFHLALIKASRNSALISICERLDAKIQQLRIAQNLPEDELSYYLGQHAQMMSLLKNGEKEACKHMLYEHITHDLTSHLGKDNA
jgi:DNA-binding GntR family transcriptional regulator